MGIVQSHALLDLAYIEDVAASVDMNLVMNGEGQFIELQGTGEESGLQRASNWPPCWRWARRASANCCVASKPRWPVSSIP